MRYGVYIIDKDEGFISDTSDFFEISPDFYVAGSNSLVSDAVEEIKINPAVKCVIIGQDMFDDTFEVALKKLSAFPIAKVVVLNYGAQEELKDIATLYKNTIVLTKPLGLDQISDSIAELVRTMEEPESIEDEGNKQSTDSELAEEANNTLLGFDYSVADIDDNPYLDGLKKSEITDVKERLRNIRREQPQPTESRIIPQKVIAVYNPKGGVGKTTIAIDLAVAIHKMILRKNSMESNIKVCLCDFDFAANDISIMMNFDPKSKRTVGAFAEDLRKEAKRISDSKGSAEPVENLRIRQREVEQKYLQFHETGIYVLASPADLSSSISKGEVKAIIETLKQCDFDIIIIDTGPNILDSTIAALSMADNILAVSTCEITSATRLSSVIQQLQGLPGFIVDKFKLVINKYDDRDNISPNELSQLLMMENYGIIPVFRDIGNIHNYGYSAFNNQTYVDKNTMTRYIESVMKLGRKVINLDVQHHQKKIESRKGILSRLKKKTKNRSS